MICRDGTDRRIEPHFVSLGSHSGEIPTFVLFAAHKSATDHPKILQNILEDLYIRDDKKPAPCDWLGRTA
jgi:hypothetical protein